VIRSTLPDDVELVLDASLFLSAISPGETHHGQARALYDAAPEAGPFLVPALFRVEVLSALARRRESSELLDLVDTLVSGPRFRSIPVEAPLLERAASVASSARLRAYDAVYAALALEQNAALLTLDDEVCVKLNATFAELVLVTLEA